MTSPSGASKKKKSHPWLTMILTLVALMVFFFVLFPEKAFFRSLMSGKASDISILYLKNLLAADPDNKEIKLELAGQEFEISQLEQAKQRIESELVAEPKNRIEWGFLLLHFQISKTETYALKEHSQQRMEREGLLVQLLQKLSSDSF